MCGLRSVDTCAPVCGTDQAGRRVPACEPPWAAPSQHVSFIFKSQCALNPSPLPVHDMVVSPMCHLDRYLGLGFLVAPLHTSLRCSIYRPAPWLQWAEEETPSGGVVFVLSLHSVVVC